MSRGLCCLGIQKYKQLYLVQAVDTVGEKEGGKRGEIMSPFLYLALSALIKIWGLRCVWRLLDKARRTIKAVQEHAVMYLFLNCRAALNSLHTVASDSLQFFTSDLKSFYLPQLFLSSLHTRGRLGDQKSHQY